MEVSITSAPRHTYKAKRSVDMGSVNLLHAFATGDCKFKQVEEFTEAVRSRDASIARTVWSSPESSTYLCIPSHVEASVPGWGSGRSSVVSSMDNITRQLFLMRVNFGYIPVQVHKVDIELSVEQVLALLSATTSVNTPINAPELEWFLLSLDPKDLSRVIEKYPDLWSPRLAMYLAKKLDEDLYRTHDVGRYQLTRGLFGALAGALPSVTLRNEQHSTEGMREAFVWCITGPRTFYVSQINSEERLRVTVVGPPIVRNNSVILSPDSIRISTMTGQVYSAPEICVIKMRPTIMCTLNLEGTLYSVRVVDG